jgi:hypothetical protein
MHGEANHLALIRSFLFDSARRERAERQIVQKNYCSAQQRKSIADRIEIRAAPRDFSVADRVRARTSHAQLALISSLFSVIEKIESRSHYLRAHARAMRVLVPNFCAVNVARKREYTFPYAKSLIFSSLCSNPNAVPVDSRPH